MNEYKELARLVGRVRKGDKEAFAQIYRMSSKSVYYIALRMLKNEDDAWEILQDVMFSLYRNIDSVRNPQLLTAFLNRTTYNACLKRLQAQKGNALALDEEYDFVLSDLEETDTEFIPEEYIKDRERRDYIIGLVEELGPSLRTVVLMFYYEELPVKQIAQTLEVNENTIKNRLFRARSLLKEKIEQEMPENALHALTVPALTQILQQSADSVFSIEGSAQVWENLGSQLGFPAAVVTATTTAATATTAGVTGVSVVATAGGAVATKIVTAAIVTAVATAAVLLGAGVVSSEGHVDMGTNPEAQILDETAPLGYQEGITPGYPAGDDIDANPSSASGIPTQAEENPRPDDDAAEYPTPDPAGATTPAEESGTGGGQRITVVKDTLYYPAGTVLSEAKVIADSGAEGTNSQPLEVVGLELVDAGTPSEYGVFVQEKPRDGVVEYRIAVVIVIQ